MVIRGDSWSPLSLNQIDSFSDGLQMLIQNGMGVKQRDLNVEYSGYVALALGIGDPFP